MTFQPGANLYTQGFGSRPESVEVPHYDVRAPSTSDILYPIGKEWIYVGNSIWKLLSVSSSQGVTSAIWVQIADSNGPVQAVLGTASQVTVTNNAGTATVSLPSAVTTPGSLTTTTTLVGGTGVTATIGNITATNGNIVRGTAGNKDVYTSVASTDAAGANSAGTVALVNGTVTVATTAVTANSLIRLTRQGVGTTGANLLGYLTVGTIVAGVSFIINAVQAKDATAIETDDQSIVFWEIVN